MAAIAAVPQPIEEARERDELEAARRRLANALDDPERLGRVTPRRPFVMPLRARRRILRAGVLFPAAATACAVLVRQRRERVRRVVLARRLVLGVALLGGAALGALAIATASRRRAR